MSRRTSTYYTPSDSGRRSRSRDESEDLARDFDYAMSLQTTERLYERGLSDQDLSPYHPLYNARRQPRGDAGYSSRDYSRDRASDGLRYERGPSPPYRAPIAPTSSRSSNTDRTSSCRSTGERTPSSRPSEGRPPRHRVIHNNGSVIYNNSDRRDDMRSAKEADIRYYIGSSNNSRDERRRGPEPRYREPRRRRDLREDDESLLEEDEGDEEYIRRR